MALQAHLDIPPGGIPVGPRQGPLCATLDRGAKEAGICLRWPARLLNAADIGCRRMGLAKSAKRFFTVPQGAVRSTLRFGEDREEIAVVDRRASNSDIELIALHAAVGGGSGASFVIETEMIGGDDGAQGKLAWLLGRRLDTGLRPTADFERMAEYTLQVRN